MLRTPAPLTSALGLMNKISKWLLRRTLLRLLPLQCPAVVPRSGAAGAAINCFITRVDSGDEPYLVLLALNGDIVDGIQWDGHSFATSISISLESIDISALRIFHMHGLRSVSMDLRHLGG